MRQKRFKRLPRRRRFRYLLETALVYVFYSVFRIMPVDMASNTCGWVFRQIGPRLGASRKAEKNIAFALPELSAARQRQALLDMWENLGRVFAEYPHLKTLKDRIELVGGEHLDQIRGGPGILVSGHFANWEVCPIIAEKCGVPIHVVYRRPNNLYLDGLLNRLRAQGGAAGTIPKNIEGARKMVSVLKKNGHLGVLIDQKFNNGIAVPFFGADAMTTPAVTQMAGRLDCPLLPARIERLKGARFRVTVYPSIQSPKTGDAVQDSYIMLTEIHKMFEDWIRAQPGQWLWLHRRWPKHAVLDKEGK